MALTGTEPKVASDAATTSVRYSLWQVVGYALKLSTLGFGGPVALVGYARR